MTGIAGTPAFIPPERIKGATRSVSPTCGPSGDAVRGGGGQAPARPRRGAADHARHPERRARAPGHAGRLAPVLKGLLRKDPALRMNYDEAERLLRAVAEGEGEPKAARAARAARQDAVMPAVMSPSSPAAPQHLGHGRDRPGDPVPGRGLPRHGGEAGRRRPRRLPSPRSLPRPHAGKASGARREGAGRGGTAEARVQDRAETRPAEGRFPFHPHGREPLRHGRAPFPRPGPSRSLRHARPPETGRTPSLPYGSPSRPRGPTRRPVQGGTPSSPSTVRGPRIPPSRG